MASTRIVNIRKSMMVTMKSTESIHKTEATKFVVLICNPRTCDFPLRENWLHNLYSVTKVKTEQLTLWTKYKMKSENLPLLLWLFLLITRYFSH